MTSYHLTSVPVRGGDLAVGVWGPEDGPVLLAVHGITASHLAWSWLAQALPDHRIIAPDLRGRGRSGELPGPWGMSQHAEDLIAVLDHFSLDAVRVVGHSMGGFVSATLGMNYPERVIDILLVDGGLPLPVPKGVAPEDLPEALIGPAAQRLALTFASEDAYLDFWREHPAFGADWNETLEDYLRYDLKGEAPNLRSTVSADAVRQDSLELALDTEYPARLREVEPALTFLRTERGLLNEEPPLYPLEQLEGWKARLPNIRCVLVDDINHYTITMSSRGIAHILEYLNIHQGVTP